MTGGSGRRPRVVVLDHTAQLAGGEIALLRLLGEVDRAAVDVHVVLFAEGPLVRRLEAIGMPVDVVPLDPTVGAVDRRAAARLSRANLTRAAAAVPFVRALTRRVRQLRPDVLYTTTLKSDLLGSAVAARLRVPLVWHVHDRIAPDYLPAATVALFRLAARHVPDRVVVNSQATACTLPGVSAVVAYPGFGADEPAPVAAVRQRTTRSDNPVVGLVGRISPTKGQLELVRAAARVLQDHPTVRFRLIGSAVLGGDEYGDRVRAEVARLGIEDAVEWTGFVDEPLRAIDDLDVLVHASPVPEPFGQVIVEGMIRGVPVVATRAGGVPEIVDPGGEPPLGLLVEPGSAEALAVALLDVLADPEAARSRAVRAYSSAVARFPVRRTAENVTQVWCAAAARRSTDRVLTA